MSDPRPTPDPIDKAYAQAEALLDDEAARAERRARVLAAVAGAPAQSASPARRPTWRHGGWLAAASVAGLSVFIAVQVYRPTGHEAQSGAKAPAAQVSTPSMAPTPVPATTATALQRPSAGKAAPEPAVPAPTTSEVANAPRNAVPAPQTKVAPSQPTVRAPVAEPERRAFPAAAAPPPPQPAPPPSPIVTRDQSAPGPAAGYASSTARGADDDLAKSQDTAREAEQRPPSFKSMAEAPEGRVEASAGLVSDPAARLRAAAAAGKTAEVKALLDQGVAVDAPDADGDTALIESVRAGRREAAAVLRRHGASLDHRNHAGESARDIAAAKGEPAMDRALGTGP